MLYSTLGTNRLLINASCEPNSGKDFLSLITHPLSPSFLPVERSPIYIGWYCGRLKDYISQDSLQPRGANEMSMEATQQGFWEAFSGD